MSPATLSRILPTTTREPAPTSRHLRAPPTLQ
ncbi:hypothetical protein chiPu_0027112, partial [Chiloscyllium punctatum]|nr:hypothetical protein [Chiloscyllium punctatum]